MKITRKELVGALCDVLDGVDYKEEIHSNTGLELKRCEEILAIRDGVKEEWMK